MGIKKFLKDQVIAISFAMSNVEKNAFSQKGEDLNKNIMVEQKHNKGTLADSLLQGRVSQEVKLLRWRTYKVLKAANGLITEITGYEEDGTPITKIRKIDRKKGLNKVKIDDLDSYPLVMVVDNTPIVTSGNDAMDNDKIITQDVVINYDDKGEIISATHGSISGDEYYATTKAELPITVIRETTPKFEIETYTKRLNIRMIDETKYLLEFYISIYSDNTTNNLFISDIKKAILNPRVSSMLDIKKVEFVTYKTLGTDDFLEYQYKILNFDKIITFNGHYVIKFIGEVIIDGRDITEQYRVDYLDEKYKNKLKK